MNSKLYIGNLSPAVGEEELRQLFSQAGAVTAVKLIVDPVTHQSRGFAFVTMATPELAAAALRDFHSYALGGRNITVTEARPVQQPKGLMSEGFASQTLSEFRPAPQREGRQRRGGAGSRRKRSRKGHGRERTSW